MEKSKRKINSKKIALIAIFAAIGVVLNIFSSQMPKIPGMGRMSLNYCYCTLVGVLLGPWIGGITAAVADLFPALVLPEGGQVWMPLITVSNGVMAIISGLCVKKLPLKSMFLKLFCAAFVSFVVCTLGFTAAGETLLYCYFGSAPFYPTVTGLVNEGGMQVYPAFVVYKAMTQPFWIAANLAVSFAILGNKAMQKYLKKEGILPAMPEKSAGEGEAAAEV